MIHNIPSVFAAIATMIAAGEYPADPVILNQPRSVYMQLVETALLDTGTTMMSFEAARHREAAARTHELRQRVIERFRTEGRPMPPHLRRAAGLPPLEPEIEPLRARLHLHLQPASNDWRQIAESVLECRDIRNHFLKSASDLDVIVFVEGVDTLRAVQLAIDHDEGIVVGDWQPFTRGASIPSSGWPGSGEYIALVLRGGSALATRLHPIGRFRVRGGSVGAMTIVPIPGEPREIGAVRVIDASNRSAFIESACALGRLSIGDGVAAPPDPCADCP